MNRMWIKRVFLPFACTLVLAACASQPTGTLAAVPTSRPANTSTPVPPAPTPALRLIDLKSGGFSLTVQPDLDLDIDDYSVNFSDPGGEHVISLNGRPYVASSYTLESFLGKYLAEMASRGGSFNQGAAYGIIIDGMNGIAIDLHGSILDQPMAGKAIAVSPGKDFIVFGLGMSSLRLRENAWNESGSPLFEATIGSIKFRDEVKR